MAPFNLFIQMNFEIFEEHRLKQQCLQIFQNVIFPKLSSLWSLATPQYFPIPSYPFQFFPIPPIPSHLYVCTLIRLSILCAYQLSLIPIHLL